MRTIAIVVAGLGAPVARAIDPLEDLQYFSFWGYATVATVYSALVVSGDRYLSGPAIFSKQNARSIPQIVAAHAAYVTILLCLLRFTTYLIFALPRWMTDTFYAGRHGVRTSIVDILFCVASLILALIERRRLSILTDSDSGNAGNAPELPTSE